MSTLKLSIAAILLAAACTLAGDLPERSFQRITSESKRTKVFLETGELLMVEISSPAGNVEGMKIDVGKTGLKLIHSAIRRDTTNDGQRAVGAANIVLLFEAEKAASGKLVVSLDQVFAKTGPFKLDVVVEDPAGAAAE